ncbi:MAG TPA: hypothetical protein ENJ09_16035 [Planctomycetes bacterium]|nr:hypothetical protein [Planctomycetota bacterium]
MNLLKRAFGATLRFLGSINQAGMAGAFLFFVLLVQEKGPRVGHLILGWFYGIAVLGLIRLFRVRPWAYGVIGLLAGPVPAAVLFGKDVEGGEWAGVWLMGAVFGLLVGLIECARVQRRATGEEPGE